jgi:MerR family transcriptional regulator, copper efflux regulator
VGDAITIGEASRRTGWSPRMLRYLEQEGLVVPGRSAGGYRNYGVLELNQLRTLTDLRQQFGVELTELAFAVRLRSEPDLRAAVETWLAGSSSGGHETPAWVEWDQRKHERLLAAREAA